MDLLDSAVLRFVQDNLGYVALLSSTSLTAGYVIRKALGHHNERTMESRVKLAEEQRKIAEEQLKKSIQMTVVAPSPNPALTPPTGPNLSLQNIPGKLNWRDTSTNLLPPRSLYENANREVFILGPTCKQTILSYADILKSLLLSGKTVTLVMLKPGGEHTERLSKVEGVDLSAEVTATVALLEDPKRHKLTGIAGFQYFLVDMALPYTAVLIDGDICAENEVRANVSNAILRVQPRAFTKSQHAGPILQLTSSGSDSTFRFFAADLRGCYRIAKGAA